MTSRALKHPRFGKAFGLLRRKTSSRRAHIAEVRQLYQATELVQDGCMLCGADAFDLLANCDRYGFDLQKQICRNCGLVQTYPALSNDFLNVFYRDHYRRLYTKSDTVNYASLMAEQTERGERFLAFLRDALPDGDLSQHHVIEIGCSAGGILNHFKDHAKSVQGCDLDEAAIDYARRTFGIDVEVSDFPSTLPEGPRIFLMSHVLEHIVKPKTLLARIRSAMSPDDCLFIEVPGLNKVAEGSYSNNLRSYFHIAHVADYTAATLSLMLRINGFDALRCDETVTGVFKKAQEISRAWTKGPNDTVDNVLRIERTFRSFG